MLVNGGKQKRTHIHRPWRSTGTYADYWDGVRRMLVPRPTAAQFVRLCDDLCAEGRAGYPNENARFIWDYIRFRLSSGQPLRALLAEREAAKTAGLTAANAAAALTERWLEKHKYEPLS